MTRTFTLLLLLAPFQGHAETHPDEPVGIAGLIQNLRRARDEEPDDDQRFVRRRADTVPLNFPDPEFENVDPALPPQPAPPPMLRRGPRLGVAVQHRRPTWDMNQLLGEIVANDPNLPDATVALVRAVADAHILNWGNGGS
jgi:hypothetical protein